MQLSHPMVEMRERAFEQAECARYERRALLHANGTAVPSRVPSSLDRHGQDARVDVVGYLCLIQYLYQRDTVIDFSHDFTCRQRYMVSASVLPPDILLPQRPHGRGLTET